MRWIQQVNTPVEVLTTVEQVEQFMNKEIKDLEKKVIQTVKVLGLFYPPCFSFLNQKIIFLRILMQLKLLLNIKTLSSISPPHCFVKKQQLLLFKVY